ncbi:MAG: hypothetical protein ACFFCW_16040 [Candidatus Hodarchaeota archaeon]
MKFPVDSYDIKARYAPGLLLALPLLITFWTCFQSEVKAISPLFGGLLSGAIFYALSVLVRALGKRIEPMLWESWGGAPSSVLVSWSDNRLGDDLKAKYHEIVQQFLGLPMPSKEEEEADPKRAAKLIEQAFARIKGLIRKEDKAGLWSVANAEYGFARNLYGSRVLWLVLSLSMIAVSAGFLWKKYSSLVLIGFISDFLILIACVVFGWFILPKYTQQVGFRYAEHAWESFLNIIETPTRQKEDTRHAEP